MKKQNKEKVRKKRKSRTKNNYAYALKRRVVDEIQKGITTKEEAMLKYGIRSRQSINQWIEKYWSLNYRTEKDYGMKESPEETIKRLKLEVEALQEDKMILNTAIDLADELYKANIRKKYLPQQLKRYKKHKSSEKGEK